MNPLLKMLAPNLANLAQPQNSGGNVPKQDIIGAFKKFAQEYKGNPEADIRGMLERGEITQEQLNAAIAKAKKMEPILKAVLR